jgi:serine/threonine protein kinase
MATLKQIDGYKIFMGQKLGEGSYGIVYVGQSETTQEKVAVKILSKAKSNSPLTQLTLMLISKARCSPKSRSWNT